MKKKYPFKFLDAYSKEDAEFFFGRDEEINTLYQMVFQTNILLVYGASGTGKSSLIQCGLAGRFQPHDWLSLFIRRGNDLNASLAKILEDAGGLNIEDEIDFLNLIDEENSSITATIPISPLARTMKSVYRTSFRPIYLIFDQFEELFILGTKNEQDIFISTVQEILKMEQPVKLIFSIREEYLGHLYDFEKKVPQLMRKKLRIEPMTLDKVNQVITGIARLNDSNVSVTNGEETAITGLIFDKIKGSDNTHTIQLPYLQVFLDKLYLQITGDNKRETDATIAVDNIARMGTIGDILRDFLEEQVQAISLSTSAAGKQVSVNDIWKILSPFATLEGTKEPLSIDKLHERLPDTDTNLAQQIVSEFVNRRILRYAEDGIYELVHDTLAKQVAGKRSDEEISLLEVKRLIRGQANIKADAQELFTEKQLNFIEPYLAKLVLSDDERQLIDTSKKEVIIKKKKLRLTRVIIGIVLIAAIIYTGSLAYWAFQKKNETEIALNYAKAESEKAKKNEMLAQKALKDLKKQQVISTAKEMEKYGDSYRDNGNIEYARDVYKDALDTLHDYKDNITYKHLLDNLDSMNKLLSKQK